MAPAAGQYLLGCSLEAEEVLPVVLYLAWKEGGGSLLTGSIPGNWIPGGKVWLRGPSGKGFHLPTQARRVALASLTGGFSRLAPLAQAAIRQGAAVSLFSPSMPAVLPAEVEVLPLQALNEAWSWADYAALEAGVEQIEHLGALLGSGHFPRLPFQAEILIITRFACAGVADCGVCAVEAGGRYHLACKDGPVFPLNLLDW
jgi:hypothetical protein